MLFFKRSTLCKYLYVHCYQYQTSGSMNLSTFCNKPLFPDFSNAKSTYRDGLYHSPIKRHMSQTFSETIFYKMSSSKPVIYFQDTLTVVHDYSGLSWWVTIVIATAVLRSCITFPMAVYQAYITAKVENISSLVMPEIAKEKKVLIAMEARKNKWSEKEAILNFRRTMKDEWTKIIVKENCHPAKASLPIWFQIPTWICFSTALRNLAYKMPHRDETAEITFMELSVGGPLWISNLTAPDPYYALPVILGLSNLVIVEIQSMMQMREPNRLQRYVTNFFRFISIALIPIASVLPSSLCLYWSTSSLLGLAQNLTLMSNRVRSKFGIPDTPSTLDHPYRQLAHEISLKFHLKK